MKSAQDEGFDLAMVREYSERQRQDAQRIVTLCDALARTVAENLELKKAAAAPKPAHEDAQKG